MVDSDPAVCYCQLEIFCEAKEQHDIWWFYVELFE